MALPRLPRPFLDRRLLALAAAGLILALALFLRPVWRPLVHSQPERTPQVAGPLLAGQPAVYVFRSPVDVLAGLDVRLATYARQNDSRLILELKEAGSDRLLARTEVRAAGLIDWGFAPWRFKPISGAGGREFVLTLLAPEAGPESCLAVLFLSPPEKEAVSFRLGGREVAGSLPVRIVTAVRIPPWASTHVWLAILAAACLAWLIWPAPAAGRELPPPLRPDRPARTLALALLVSLAVSLACGWPNIVEKERVEGLGYHHQPTPGDEIWYAEFAHKFGLLKRFPKGDFQAYEASEIYTPHLGIALPLGLLGAGDRLLGPARLGYLVDFLLPALMVLLIILGVRFLGGTALMGAVMGLGLVSFPHWAPFYMIGAHSWSQAWSILLQQLMIKGTYFTTMGQPQVSGFFAALAGLALWAAYGRGGRGLGLAAALSLGALFYTDLFFQHILVGTAGMLIPVSLLRRDWTRAKRAALVLSGTLLVGLGYWVNTFLFLSQPWARESVLENGDPTRPFSFVLQPFEVNSLWLVAVVLMVYLTLVAKRGWSPGPKAAADWQIDLTFAPVWAFAFVFMADQVTGVNPQKHHYYWRGLSMWLPVAAGGWGWWWLERRWPQGRGRKAVLFLSLLVILACLFKLVQPQLFLPGAGRPPAGWKPPHVAAISPGMKLALDRLNQEAGPEDVVLTLDYEQIKWVNTLTPCYTYIQTLMNSVLLAGQKADRIAWGFALLKSKVSPADYLDYTIHGPAEAGPPARSRYLARTFEGRLMAVWAPLGLRYHDSVARATALAGERFQKLKRRGVTPRQSPYRVDWVLVGPLERQLGVDLDPRYFRPLIQTPGASLYRVIKGPG